VEPFHDPGYRTVSSNGTVDSFNVTPHGSHTGTIPSPIVGIGADHETGRYWLVSARGDVYGIDAPFLGSLPDSHVSVPRPVRAIAGTADGRGYWLLDADAWSERLSIRPPVAIGWQSAAASIRSMHRVSAHRARRSWGSSPADGPERRLDL
jgi:hypothetical protein